jgi:GNAT superfamily N-acetyltransferase
MSETSVRVLHEDDWRDYRAVRRAALQESPQAFLATYAEEATQPEQYWRNCMVRAHRLLAELDGAAVGVASVEMIKGAPHSADFHDLWVTPEARNTGGSVAPGPSRRSPGDSGRLYQAVLLGQHRKWARHRVRHQCWLPADVAASYHPYQQQRVRRPGNRTGALPRPRPSCSAHLDNIPADLEARPPLTKHHGCGTRGCQTQIPGTTSGTVTISLCRSRCVVSQR